MRRGTRDEALIGTELRDLLTSRSTTHFESTPTAALVKDADPELLESLKAAFRWSDNDPEKRLQEARYSTSNHLSVAGALYLVEEPHEFLGKSFVEILRFREDDTPDYDLRIEVKGPLPKQLEESSQRVGDLLGSEMVVLGVRRYEIPPVPAVVLREAISNALAHRSYELDRVAVRIELRPSFVRITSPGGLPEPVTVENIRETNAPRNIAVITALRRFGLAEDAGRGIDVMQDAMREEMLSDPVIQDLGHAVQVTLPLRSVVAPEERAWIAELERRGTLSGPDRMVLVYAARGEILTNARVREILQADRSTARLVLQRLRDAGFLVQEGDRGGASYALHGSLAPPAGLRLEKTELLDLIEDLAEAGPVSNAKVRAVTGLDRVEARRLLSELVRAGRLAKIGERRGTRYVLPP